MTDISILIPTYKRTASLNRLLESITGTTSAVDIVVCDDENSDSTKEVALRNGAYYITGENKGVCWNKNRGLYFIANTLKSNRYLIIEDDCQVDKVDWLDSWVTAIDTVGHINYAHPVTIMSRSEFLVSGSGQPSDPYLTTMLTGQCTGGTSKSLAEAGYLSSLFRGYGHGHVEWTLRNIDTGHGGGHKEGGNYHFFGINYGIVDHMLPTFKDQSSIDANFAVLRDLRKSKKAGISPWETEEESVEFLAEQNNTLAPPVK
ncbi:MAG: glycosyltransferase [Ferrovibrio sp.]|uniref:glycosyltransferase family 2 protein n=1 Tax=Ferrovibrio sp. TaxID=1917215 RepID=UPI002624090A|nr:glycosyltransferase [Ferrovibrio sp.]MCW0233209.1 glycosyltransferase [Ferrovibrio sp.]